jgi:murein DD-endopeptidase MepM/ murein hydrolase activator NlpD
VARFGQQAAAGGGQHRRTPLSVTAVTPLGVRVVDVRPQPPRPRRRGWTLLVAPPATIARPLRTLHLGRWSPRAALGLVGGLMMSLMVASLIGGVTVERRISGERMAAASAAIASAEERVASLADSLRLLHAALAVATAPPRVETPAARPATARAKRATSASAPPPVVRRATPLRLADGVVLPITGRITSNFARRRYHPILGIPRAHLGVDLGAPSGTPIATPAAGHVSFVGRKLGYGLVVEIKHPGGVLTRYAHTRQAYVKAGQQVEAGQTIAAVGASGLATAPHLHYEVRVNGDAVDPVKYAFARTPASGRAMAAEAPDSATAPESPAPVELVTPAPPANDSLPGASDAGLEGV